MKKFLTLLLVFAVLLALLLAFAPMALAEPAVIPTETSPLPGAGDVVHGSLTVVHAVNDAKNAAAAMMRYMEEHE